MPKFQPLTSPGPRSRLEDYFSDCGGPMCVAALSHAGVVLGAGALGCTPAAARATRAQLIEACRSDMLLRRARLPGPLRPPTEENVIELAAIMLAMAIEIVEGADGRA